jgi:hypothetical protein
VDDELPRPDPEPAASGVSGAPGGPPPAPAHLVDGPADRPASTRRAVVAGGLAAALTLGLGAPLAWQAGGRAAEDAALAVWGPGGETIVVDALELTRRTDDACQRLVGRRGPEPEGDRSHLDDDEAADLSVDDLYDLRPPHSGRHLGAFLPVPEEPFDGPVDERALVHNLEHGAIAVLYDPEALDPEDLDALTAWLVERNGAGFHEDAERTGAGILVAPVEPGTITSGGALALRAWGVATDCEGFDPVVADGFLASHFGTRGTAPEGFLAPYPSGAVEVVRPDV